MDEYEELKALVEQLKRNREKVPLKELKTRYKKPYEELLGKISKLSSRIMNEQSLKGIAIRKDDKGRELVDAINQMIEKQREPGGIMKRASQALFGHYDVNEFKTLVAEMRTIVWNMWIPYWSEHCCIYATPENFEEPYPSPRIYNELTGEFLSDDGTWSKHPEWETKQRTIITAGACRILAGALREKEKKDGQTGEH